MVLLSDAVLTQKVPGEPATTVQADGIEIKSKRIGKSEMCSEEISGSGTDRDGTSCK